MIEALGASQAALMATAMGVGVAGSAHCVGMCGPFALLTGQTRGWKGVTVYAAGRTFTYALLGALAGVLGSALTQLRLVGGIVSLLIVVAVALQLAGVLPEWRWGARLAARASGRLARAWSGVGFLLGLATALMPCGLVYAAMGIAVAAGSPLAGALVMVAFGLGTWPAQIALGVGALRVLGQGPRLRQLLAVAVGLAGLWAIQHRGEVDLPTQVGEQVSNDCCHGH